MVIDPPKGLQQVFTEKSVESVEVLLAGRYASNEFLMLRIQHTEE